MPASHCFINTPLVQKAEHELYEKVRNASRGLNMRLAIGIQEGHLITPGLKAALSTFCQQNQTIQIDVINCPYIRLFEQLNSGELDVAFALEFRETFIAILTIK